MFCVTCHISLSHGCKMRGTRPNPSFLQDKQGTMFPPSVCGLNFTVLNRNRLTYTPPVTVTDWVLMLLPTSSMLTTGPTKSVLPPRSLKLVSLNSFRWGDWKS